MPSGLVLTTAALAKSRNEAATAILVAALESADTDVAEAAVRGLFARRSTPGHLAVLAQWPRLSDAQRRSCDIGRGKLGKALRNALLSGDDILFEAAGELARRFDEFDLVAPLIHVAENESSPHALPATKLIQDLVHQLSAHLRLPTQPQSGPDRRIARHVVLENLERSITRFRRHQRRELVECFVLLAGHECTLLRTILESPHHACFQEVLNTLTHSTSPAVVDLLISILKLPKAPQVVAKAASKRTDPGLVGALLALVGEPEQSQLAANLSQITEFAWLANPADFVARYPDPTPQSRALQLAALTGIRADARLALAEGMLRTATAAGRAAALDLIAAVPGDRANQVLREALSDADPAVRAAAARPLRDRPVPGVMGRLIELVSDPHPEVCAAAREALAEFSLENFLLKYDTLEDTIRTTTGVLVLKVDARAIEKLGAELGNSNRQRRLRAIQAAETMGALPSIAHALVERLDDDDHHVRAAAVEALQHCSGSDVRSALIAALGDRSLVVQRAAQASLSQWQATEVAANGARRVNARTG